MRQEVLRSKRAAFADGTARNLRWQWKLFIMFCAYFRFKILPASIECLCLYAQFLSRSMRAVDSIRNYLSGVCTLHVLCDIPYMGKDNVELKLLLRGLARSKPHMTKQAAPLSPNIMARMRQFFNFDNTKDCVMWALLLLMFFTMSRKSNMVVTGSKKFDEKKQLCRSDVAVGTHGLLVTFRWSKTNQFGGRAHKVPILAISGSSLCPVSAFKEMLKKCPGCPNDPAFFLPRKSGKIRWKEPVSYKDLQDYIKNGEMSVTIPDLILFDNKAENLAIM